MDHVGFPIILDPFLKCILGFITGTDSLGRGVELGNSAPNTPMI